MTEEKLKRKKAFTKSWAKNNAEYVKAYAKSYRERNREEINAKGREYRKRPEVIEAAKAYRKANKEKIKLHQNTRKEKLKKMKIEDPVAYEEHLRKHRIKNNRYNERNREKCRERSRNVPKELRSFWSKRAYYKNHEKSLADAKRRMKYHVDNLSPCYVNDTIRHRGLDPSEMSEETKEVFKLQIMIKRELGMTNITK